MDDGPKRFLHELLRISLYTHIQFTITAICVHLLHAQDYEDFDRWLKLNIVTGYAKFLRSGHSRDG
jgi:hypothetical protein